ncbi:molybdopterin adenylyltransferase [Ammoniphilus resinae]|uniref:Molybdenum cofactor synthesis domain-containing protein n=1 Tax=Ammoniphilus resinae TaxID=861532 RepID=A0ABS4GXS7_9BACL|nr:molybdopterin adenylyltransferase [Ammoniphilus resinae]MBP1935068.1 molybdenum cofactor synthesis domain-containing protein [Ammoniphilus resinae]
MDKWKVGILTASDKGSRGEREDISGSVIKELVSSINGEVIQHEVVADEQEWIKKSLIELADVTQCDLIFTTGGTGFAARDVTPEATKAVIEREVPGIPERMRAATLVNTKFAILSRAAAGIRGNTLIINLPGSPKGVKECFESIADVLPHALKLLRANLEHDQEGV